MTAQHSQNLPSETEVRRPSPDHKKTESLKSSPSPETMPQPLGPLPLLFQKNSFHYHQDFPHCALTSSVWPIRGVSINTILLLPFRHFWCPYRFPTTCQSRHERNRFGTKKNVVVHACCGHLPLCSTFSRNSTIPFLVSFVNSKKTFGWKSSHPTPFLALYNNSHFFSQGKGSSNFFSSSFFHGLSSTFCTLSSHCQCFAHSFLFASQRSNNLAPSSSFFKICTPPLHVVGFVILWRSPALPSALLISFSTFR